LKRIRVIANAEELAALCGEPNGLGFTVVGLLQPGVAYLPRVVRRLQPQLVLLDATKEGWLALAAALREALPKLPVVVIGPDDPGTVKAAYGAGIHSYLPMNTAPRLLTQALGLICETGFTFWTRSLREVLEELGVPAGGRDG